MKLAAASERYARVLAPLELPDFAERDPARPLIVALEGPNGVGKSSLAPALAAALAAPALLGIDPAWFGEDFKVRMIRDAGWPASAMFFLSGCLEQMRVLRGRPEPLIVLDRCLWSTLAVHAAETPQRLYSVVGLLAAVAPEVPVPDLTLVLAADFTVCQSRIARKSGTARRLDELTAQPAFHDRELGFYQWLAAQRREVRWMDARPPAPEVLAAAVALVREFAPGRPAAA